MKEGGEGTPLVDPVIKTLYGGTIRSLLLFSTEAYVEPDEEEVALR